MVGIHADLCGQIKRHRKPCGAVRQQVFVTLVGLFRISHAGVLAHGPEASAVHGGLYAPGIGELAGIAYVGIVVPAFQIRRGIERLGLNRFQLAIRWVFEVVSHA